MAVISPTTISKAVGASACTPKMAARKTVSPLSDSTVPVSCSFISESVADKPHRVSSWFAITMILLAISACTSSVSVKIL